MNDIDGLFTAKESAIKPPPMKPIAGALPVANSEEFAITEDVIAKLEEMPTDELIALIKLVSGAMWGIGLLTKEETREAMKLKIANIALTAKDNQTILKACNDWLDREEGKATQRIEQKVLNVNSMKTGEMTNEELFLAISKLSDSKQLPIGIKRLPDGRLEVDDAEYTEVTDT